MDGHQKIKKPVEKNSTNMKSTMLMDFTFPTSGGIRSHPITVRRVMLICNVYIERGIIMSLSTSLGLMSCSRRAPINVPKIIACSMFNLSKRYVVIFNCPYNSFAIPIHVLSS